tara:strand:- start:1067 stop:2593 length:1527 start_codon:yes stop_codon:yes gene_type:complete
MAEQELRAANKDSSWRDKLRDEMLLKYGRTGKNIAEGLVGESEENKYLNFLLKKYGTYDLSKLPPEVRENIPMNRPLGEMKNIGSGGGISDIGAADALLMGMSPYSWPAALTESGILGADAKGEYDKGNTVGAAIMGTIAGVPPLLRYGLGPKTAAKTTETTEPAVDEGRRSVLKGIGALGAMSTGVGKILGEGGGTAASVAGKVAKAMPKVAPIPYLRSAFGISSGAADKIGKVMKLGKGSKFDDMGGIKLDTEYMGANNYYAKQAEAGKDAKQLYIDDTMSGYDYDLDNIYYKVNELENASGKQISRAEFDKVVDEVIIRDVDLVGGIQRKYDDPQIESEYLKIGRSDEFKEAAYDYYTKTSKVLRETETGKVLSDTQKQYDEVDDQISKAYNHASQKLFNKNYNQLDSAGPMGVGDDIEHKAVDRWLFDNELPEEFRPNDLWKRKVEVVDDIDGKRFIEDKLRMEHLDDWRNELESILSQDTAFIRGLDDVAKQLPTEYFAFSDW